MPFPRLTYPVAAVLLAVALGGCDDDPAKTQPAAPPSGASARTATPPVASAPPKQPEKPKAPPAPLNVLLITIDSMRADMPWNGYERPIAPNLTKLAHQSVVYPNGYSVSSYTAKSVGAMLTGRYPSTLYRTGWFFTGYAKSNQFFTEALQEQGIRTIGWHGHMYFGRGKNLDQGFDVWELVPGITFNAQTDESVTSDKMTELGKKLLGDPENTKGQFFAWAHYMDPHDVYVQHEESPEWGKSNRDRYDSEMWYTDKHLGELLDFAKKQPWWKKTALIISADHGEAFGDHGMWKHAFEVWEVLTHVPIIVHAPGAKPKRITERRSQIDLAPTIMELMGQKPLDGFMGKSLVPELYGAVEPEPRDHIVLELPEDSHNPPRRAVIKDDWKLIVYGTGWKYLLFNLKSDPAEENDLAKENKEKLEEMKAYFEQVYEAIPSVDPYGGMKLKGGKTANGPMGPPKPPEDDQADKPSAKDEAEGEAKPSQAGSKAPENANKEKSQ